MIDIKNISPEGILNDLQEYINSQPSTSGWKDYFEGGAGRTILELLAASVATKTHYQLTKLRESSLQFAQMDSSITELAFNRGVYKPPAKMALYKVNFTSKKNYNIQKGEEIGVFGNYFIYANEAKVVSANTNNNLEVIIGLKEEFNTTITENIDYYEVEYDLINQYYGNYLEMLTLDNTSLYPVDIQLNLYNPNLPLSVLRIPSDYKVKLIFGDGVLGAKTEKNQVISLRCYTFGEDLILNYSKTNPNFYDSDLFIVQSFDIIQEPAKYMNKELLRKIAIRHSVDGRWVEGKDYESGLLREFYNILHDVYLEDFYPQERLYILGINPLSIEQKQSIVDFVNYKKGNAVQIEYHYLDNVNDGVIISANLTYVGTDDTDTINNAITKVKNEIENKIIKTDIAITSADIAIELTKLLPRGKMYADNLDEHIVAPKYSYIKTLNVNYVNSVI